MSAGEAETRLAVYGSLSPGGSNHDQLSGLSGSWLTGRLRGRVVQLETGPNAGYPGLILDRDGPTVVVQVLESPDLPDHWDRLDAFEGPGYARVAVGVVTDTGVLDAYVYALADARLP